MSDKTQIDCPFCNAPFSMETPDSQVFVACPHCGKEFLILPVSTDTIPLEYFCFANGEELGPFAAEEVMSLYEQTILDGNTTIWYDGLQEWRPIFEIFPSFSYLKQAPLQTEPIGDTSEEPENQKQEKNTPSGEIQKEKAPDSESVWNDENSLG